MFKWKWYEMAKLTQTQVEIIKALLDADSELPRSFQPLLFPPEEQDATPATTPTRDEASDFAGAMASLGEEDDMAAIATATETYVWRVPRLWSLAQELPVELVSVADLLPAFDKARWFGEDEPLTVRAVVAQAKRIMSTDLTYPIILSAEGKILDGMHRLAKAWIIGAQSIAAVRFQTDPEPDYRIPR